MTNILPLTRASRRPGRKGHARAKTIRVTRMSLREQLMTESIFPRPLHLRVLPETRGECADVPRPCPYVSCRHHLFLDPTCGGSLKLNFPDIEPDQLPANESCSLDVADRGGVTLEEVGRLTNVTRERVRQVEERVFRRMKFVTLLVELSKERGPGIHRNVWDDVHESGGASGGEDAASHHGEDSLRDRVWRRYSDGLPAPMSADQRVDDAEIDRWAERVMESLRGGSKLRAALDAANSDEDVIHVKQDLGSRAVPACRLHVAAVPDEATDSRERPALTTPDPRSSDCRTGVRSGMQDTPPTRGPHFSRRSP